MGRIGKSASGLGCFQWRLGKRNIHRDWKMIGKGIVRGIIHFLQCPGKMRRKLVAAPRLGVVFGTSFDEKPVEFVFADESAVGASQSKREPKALGGPLV